MLDDFEVNERFLKVWSSTSAPFSSAPISRLYPANSAEAGPLQCHVDQRLIMQIGVGTTRRTAAEARTRQVSDLDCRW